MQNINISGAASDDVADKLITSGLLKDVVEKIDISKYTQLFNELFIIFQCFPKANPRKVEVFKKLGRKTKTLELYLVLDYDLIMKGSEAENLQHIKEVFLKGCETFLKPLKDFKYNEFENKIKDLV